MLKIKIKDIDLSLNSDIYSEDYSSDRGFYNAKLLNLASLNVVNGVVDSEIFEYKPETFDEINYNIFFLKYLKDSEYNEITPYMETQFDEHFSKTKTVFNLIDSFGNSTPLKPTTPFQISQETGIPQPTLPSEINLTTTAQLNLKGDIVRDIIGQSILKKPNESGIPVFYNSYTLPFWQKRDRWINDPLIYSNKPYLYNSFLLMEFYDSTIISNQNRIQSVAIFANSRYNITEKNKTNRVDYLRPSFKLKEGFEGYSFYFLNNYVKNEFYVKYSFWDALNGVKIPLLPSSDFSVDKKWLQNPNDFNQKLRYVKYLINYDNKTYNLYEYNTNNGLFDIERNNFDLYQLGFDQYHTKIVTNEKPIDSKKIQKQEIEIKNPLLFDVSNLNSTINLDLGDTKTFRTPTGLNVLGVGAVLKPLTLTNIDNQVWKVKSLEFENVTLLVNGETINVLGYENITNSIKSLWNEKPSYIFTESVHIPPVFLTKQPYPYKLNSRTARNLQPKPFEVITSNGKIDIGFEFRDFAIALNFILNSSESLTPNKIKKIDYNIVIGGALLSFFLKDGSKIEFNGILKLSIINTNKEIKNINIPLKNIINLSGDTTLTTTFNENLNNRINNSRNISGRRD